MREDRKPTQCGESYDLIDFINDRNKTVNEIEQKLERFDWFLVQTGLTKNLKTAVCSAFNCLHSLKGHKQPKRSTYTAPNRQTHKIKKK